MNRTILAAVGVTALAVIAIPLARGPAGEAGDAAEVREVPRFEVDPTWPKLPSQWTMGIVSSVAVDADDHVWVLQRPRSLEPEEASRAAPPVLEFDENGDFVQGWGGPNDQYHWPDSEHGIFVDHKGFVWIGGQGDTDQVLKFTRAGELVMELGTPGEAQGNTDTENFSSPADVYVHPETNELFVADGYGNRRVIVFDADTGEFKRMWGAFGNAPTDGEPLRDEANVQTGRGPEQFVQPVHGVKVSNDGLVYVADRGGKRVQVFNLDGSYVDQAFIGRECIAPECGNGTTAASVSFSPDPEQRFLYVGNRSQARVMVFERESLELLDSFGQWGSRPGDFGTLHHMAVDSKGNLYVAEVTPLEPVNRRFQKFTFVGMEPLPANTTN